MGESGEEREERGDARVGGRNEGKQEGERVEKMGEKG